MAGPRHRSPEPHLSAAPSPHDLGLVVEQHTDRTVVAVSGEIDVRTAPWLRQALFDPEVVRHPRLVVDLDAVTFLDSVGVGTLVAARRWLTSRGTALVLVCGDNQPRRVLRMVGLHRVFDMALPSSATADPEPDPV